LRDITPAFDLEKAECSVPEQIASFFALASQTASDVADRR
jgi:hypothetical protein